MTVQTLQSAIEPIIKNGLTKIFQEIERVAEDKKVEKDKKVKEPQHWLLKKLRIKDENISNFQFKNSFSSVSPAEYYTFEDGTIDLSYTYDYGEEYHEISLSVVYRYEQTYDNRCYPYENIEVTLWIDFRKNVYKYNDSSCICIEEIDFEKDFGISNDSKCLDFIVNTDMQKLFEIKK